MECVTAFNCKGSGQALCGGWPWSRGARKHQMFCGTCGLQAEQLTFGATPQADMAMCPGTYPSRCRETPLAEPQKSLPIHRILQWYSYGGTYSTMSRDPGTAKAPGPALVLGGALRSLPGLLGGGRKRWRRPSIYGVPMLSRLGRSFVECSQQELQTSPQQSARLSHWLKVKTVTVMSRSATLRIGCGVREAVCKACVGA